jgi:threonine dehydrogenase-like Zn-dependent dehydrogenase
LFPSKPGSGSYAYFAPPPNQALVNGIVAETRVYQEGETAAAFANQYDVVVEATGNPGGLRLAAEIVRPMGTIVLKTTCAVEGDAAHGFGMPLMRF